MKEVFRNLFVGNASDYENNRVVLRGWGIVHAAKYPYHRNAVGYSGARAPQGPEYLFAYRGGELFLNMIDNSDKAFFKEEMMNEAINYSVMNLKAGRKVLIHSNQGGSRAPILAMLVMRRLHALPDDFVEAENEFSLCYSMYSPSEGLREYAIDHWIIED